MVFCFVSLKRYPPYIRLPLLGSPWPGASCARHGPWSLQQGGSVPQDPSTFPAWVPNTGDLQKSEAKLSAPRVFSVTVFSVTVFPWGQAGGMLYFATIVPSYFTLALVHILKKLLWKYSNKSKSRRVCDPPHLVLGVITFQFFSCT